MNRAYRTRSGLWMVDWRVLTVYLYAIAAGMVTGIILGLTVARSVL